MINTYRHISDHTHIFGIRPIVFVVLLVVVVLLLTFGLWLLSLIVLVIGYRYARKYRDTKISFIDLVFYITTPPVFSVEREPVDEDKRPSLSS